MVRSALALAYLIARFVSMLLYVLIAVAIIR